MRSGDKGGRDPAPSLVRVIGSGGKHSVNTPPAEVPITKFAVVWAAD